MPDSQLVKQVREICDGLSDKDRHLVLRALDFCLTAHSGQTRKSGDPFTTHPLSVALRVWERFEDPQLMAAALLHDVVEDCEHITMPTIYSEFGDTVGFLVDAVTKRRSSFYGKKVYYKDKIERLLWAGLQDVRVLLLKIADREHNISTLKHLPSTKQVRMAFETQAIYEPLKQVLDMDHKHSISDIRRRLRACMAKKSISTPKEMKTCLYSMSFKNFSHDLFNLVYDNSSKVIWEIEDKDYFENLIANPEFCDKAQLRQLWTNGNQFRAHLTFSSGFVMDSKNTELAISAYRHE